MRTTLRFTSVVGGVAALIVLAAIILSANDWLSTPPGVNQRIAVRTSAPAPQFNVPTWPAAAPTPPVTPEPGATSGPDLAPAAPAPQPIAAAVHAAVAPVARPAVSMTKANQEHGDQAGGHRHDNGGGHDRGGGHDGGGDNQNG